MAQKINLAHVTRNDSLMSGLSGLSKEITRA